MDLWTAKAAAGATGGELHGQNGGADWRASGVCIDTRELVAGDLFVALRDVRDGHDFVGEAFERGASAALVSRIPEGCEDKNLLLVDDVLQGLRDLASAARKRTKAKVIGVTGSVGKTSCKEMLRLALSAQGKIHAAERSFNNHWGVPLTLARMPADTDFAVIEIGMNHAGEIEPLARLARLDVALITTVGAVHMAAFDSVADIARAKSEIFCGLTAGGCAVINRDIDSWELLFDEANRVGARIISFGKHKDADFRLLETGEAVDSDKIVQYQTIKVSINKESASFNLSAQGSHLAMNALAILAGVQGLGASVQDSARDLEQFHSLDGRGAQKKIILHGGGEATLIDESYNANPMSMEAALDNLARVPAPLKQGRRVAIIADMLELGKDEATFHAQLAQLPCIAQIDTIHAVGDRMHSLHQALPSGKRGEWMRDADECITKSEDLIQAGDLVMLKGSFSMGLGKVVKYLTKQ